MDFTYIYIYYITYQWITAGCVQKIVFLGKTHPRNAVSVENMMIIRCFWKTHSCAFVSNVAAKKIVASKWSTTMTLDNDPYDQVQWFLIWLVVDLPLVGNILFIYGYYMVNDG